MPDSAASQAVDPLDEIQGLAEAAGAEVVGGVTQKRPTPHPRTAFGRGKVEEIGELARSLGATVVLVDFDLSPSQGRNLEKDLELRVVDRTELILDIFAQRARTRQAGLQVELAQMEYLRTRLRRMWTHLERTEGAIGTRGPGETQLESDRRLVNQKIRDLKRRLKEIEARSQRQALSREEPVTLSLVGYTNAGKSSLLNRLTGAEVYIADQLFATLDTRVRRWQRQDARDVLLADTVGFVRELPHHLVASFHATLEETLNADLLLHVCDASDPDLEIHLQAVEDVLQQLGAGEIPRLRVFNKIDQLGEAEALVLQTTHPEAVFLSAETGEGIEDLDYAVACQLDDWSLDLQLQIPAGAGKLLADLRRHSLIEEEAYQGEWWHGRVRILPRVWAEVQRDLSRAGGRFQAQPPTQEDPGGDQAGERSEDLETQPPAGKLGGS
ncbi:MAG: GTPase HflX [Planctomycetota bacterium]|nr:MAG: GTPase HflX [Planctomycetota bacterium]